jgi:hypothetical protein
VACGAAIGPECSGWGFRELKCQPTVTMITAEVAPATASHLFGVTVFDLR